MTEPLDLDLLAKVIDVIVDSGFAPRSALEPHSTLRSDLGLNLLQIYDIAIDCEVKFATYIDVKLWGYWQTVADIVRSIDMARAGAPA